ncbi:carbamoyl-phosphate synthase L chain ATP-binding protein [Pseudoxanthomonas spadix BD-a59]|uniref:Biotin carboxylase n=1 Tax=Pseudoxanthomonas spadix (strain BD-a59) TaxID=1045855 RepID=G7UV11_PSEUP|nr:acetyl/propionyl/methylcrotonyl-CoA carboxylase subunit alpha [Pseudoxanthomonas spadix]AER55090.1 carbamoyl-phosphate synthase L chain ATP-binding protein [Pseudoxanthomonas spadix BD-a59]
MFEKILIANRGEIACRIIATCRRLGIATVAVYSDADAHARHVRLADEAWRLGPAPAVDSYLKAEAILEIAARSGAQAIHPGYGFLSENAGFAAACQAAGIVFIGPPVGAIQAMGSKSQAKAIMQRAGVPLVPGYHGADQDPAQLQAQAEAIGYPVLIKASAGGGGKGMRVVTQAGDFAAALASCKRESAASFGDDTVLLERYLQQPRHIEVQVFADASGQVIHLNERDCSSQRRHQKVVEEAPAPGMTAARRAQMGQVACDAARAVGYVGAGTVEFIVGQDGAFYFMEMNTRLQVEHPVTELVTGLDLVEWQLRIAAGQPLPLTQEAVALDGHAIEARLYAEDPAAGFLPSIGTLSVFVAPRQQEHQVRLDTGVEQGDQISPYYDPMIAKLIVHGPSRPQAIARMQRALAELRIVGVASNVEFLQRLVGHPAFVAGQVDTGLIERESAALLPAAAAPPQDALHAAAIWTVLAEAPDASRPPSPWDLGDGWRLNGSARRTLGFVHPAGTREIALEYQGAQAWSLDGQPVRLVQPPQAGRLQLDIAGHVLTAEVFAQGQDLHVFTAQGHTRLKPQRPLTPPEDAQDHQAGLLAPMPGRIITLLVQPGATVEQGTPLLVMEAMKMEYTLSAPFKGIVLAFLHDEGAQVQAGMELIDFQAAP